MKAVLGLDGSKLTVDIFGNLKGIFDGADLAGESV